MKTPPTAPARARRPSAQPPSPNFGRQLARLREHSGESRGAVCKSLQRFGLTVDRSTLLQYENGKVSAPDPVLVWALGRHYGLPNCDELLSVLVMDRTGRPLRAGVDIAVSPYTIEQRSIAEAFASFADPIKQAIVTIFDGLRAGEELAAHTTTRKGA